MCDQGNHNDTGQERDFSLSSPWHLRELSHPAAGCVLGQHGCFRVRSKTNCSVNRKQSWQQTCCRWLQILQRERQWPTVLPKTKEPAWSSAHQSPLSSLDAILQAGEMHRFSTKRHLKNIQHGETTVLQKLRPWNCSQGFLLGNSGYFQTPPCFRCVRTTPYVQV